MGSNLIRTRVSERSRAPIIVEMMMPFISTMGGICAACPYSGAPGAACMPGLCDAIMVLRVMHQGRWCGLGPISLKVLALFALRLLLLYTAACLNSIPLSPHQHCCLNKVLLAAHKQLPKNREATSVVTKLSKKNGFACCCHSTCFGPQHGQRCGHHRQLLPRLDHVVHPVHHQVGIFRLVTSDLQCHTPTPMIPRAPCLTFGGDIKRTPLLVALACIFAPVLWPKTCRAHWAWVYSQGLTVPASLDLCKPQFFSDRKKSPSVYDGPGYTRDLHTC